MAKTNTPKFGLPQWGLPTDTVLRSDFNEAFSNIEGRAVKVANGKIADAFKALERHVYVIDIEK